MFHGARPTRTRSTTRPDPASTTATRSSSGSVTQHVSPSGATATPCARDRPRSACRRLPLPASSTYRPSRQGTYSRRPSGETATERGASPARYRSATVSEAVSITDTSREPPRPVSGPVSATYTRRPSGAAAMPCGYTPTVIVVATVLVARETTATVLLPEFDTYTLPAAPPGRVAAAMP